MRSATSSVLGAAVLQLCSFFGVIVLHVTILVLLATSTHPKWAICILFGLIAGFRFRLGLGLRFTVLTLSSSLPATSTCSGRRETLILLVSLVLERTRLPLALPLRDAPVPAGLILLLRAFLALRMRVRTSLTLVTLAHQEPLAGIALLVLLVQMVYRRCVYQEPILANH